MGCCRASDLRPALGFLKVSHFVTLFLALQLSTLIENGRALKSFIFPSERVLWKDIDFIGL